MTALKNHAYFIFMDDFREKGLDGMATEDLYNFHELLCNREIFNSLTDEQKQEHLKVTRLLTWEYFESRLKAS